MYHGIRTAVGLLLFALTVWFGIGFFLPLALPFLLGGGLALGAEPMVSFLCEKLKMPRGAAAALGVTAAFGFLGLLLILLCALLLRELRLLVSMLPALEQAASEGISTLSHWALALAARLPGGLGEVLSSAVTDFFSGGSRLLEQGFRFMLGLTGGVLSQVPDSALILGTAIISSYMISARLPRIRSWFRQKISQERLSRLLGSLQQLRRAVFGWLKAQLKLMGLTWVILTLGLVLLRIPFAPLWAAAVALVDAFPILGTGTVLLPWALVCLLQRDTVRAVGLLAVYTVITLSRSVLEPRLVGRQLGLDPLATLAALYAGFRLWGLGGMLLAPLLAVTAVQLTKNTQR